MKIITTCPNCKGEKHHKNGINPSGSRERFCCIDCGTTFSVLRKIPEEEIKGY